jgi:ketosteroid isomerase-like protein
MRSLFVTTLIVILALPGCAPPAEAPIEVDLEAERTALMQADRAWSESQSASDESAEVITAQFLADAYLLAPDAPLVEGREAIGTVFADLEAIPGYSLSWEPTIAEVGGAGDLGYTIGAYEMQLAPEGAAMTIRGKYMTVWKKESDGSWRVAVDMFNADGPPVTGDSPAASPEID